MAEQRLDFVIAAQNRTKQAFDEIKRSMGEVESAGASLRNKLAGLGVGLSLTGFAAFVKSGIDAADELNKLSQKVGVSVESLSAFQYAAKLADVSSEQLATGLARLARTASDAQAGSGEAAEAFRALGVSVTDAQGGLRGTEELLLDIAEKFAGMEDGAGKTALAMRLFGRAGAELIPFLNQGRSGFEALRQEAARLGIVISTDTARAAEQFNDNLTRLGQSANALKFALAESVLRPLGRVAEAMAEAVRQGEGLRGVLAALTQLSPFNDLQRASREFVEKTDELLATQREIAQRAQAGQNEEVAALREHEKRLQERLAVLTQLRAALAGETDAFGDPARPAVPKPKVSAPALRAPGGADRERDSQFQRALAQLQQEALKVQELSRFQQTLSEIEQGRYGQLSEAQRAQLLDQASLLDQLREEKRVREENVAAVEEGAKRQAQVSSAETDRLRALAQQLRDLNDPLESVRREIAQLEEAAAKGFEPDLANARIRELRDYIDEWGALQTEVKETNDIARDLGLTFSSAFEDAVVKGEKLSDVLKGLIQDIARIVFRKSVTEPLAASVASSGIGEAISGFFGGLFGGGKAAGGPVDPGRAYLVGERGPELFVPRSPGSIVPNGAAGGTTFVVDMRGASVDAVARLERLVRQVDGSLEQRAVAAVNDQQLRGVRV